MSPVTGDMIQNSGIYLVTGERNSDDSAATKRKWGRTALAIEDPQVSSGKLIKTYLKQSNVRIHTIDFRPWKPINMIMMLNISDCGFLK